MTQTPETAVAHVVESLRALIDISDPTERYQASRMVEVAIADQLRDIRKGVALELKHDRRMTWREIGQVMDGVSAQRAEQISRGK